MADGQNISQRWGDFRPSKTMLLWSCVVCVGLTMLLGFTWGGWVTGGTAKEMTESAVEDARAELAAAVCVDRFLKASDVGGRSEERRVGKGCVGTGRSGWRPYL